MPLFGREPKKPVDFTTLKKPWEAERVSIYEHIVSNLEGDDSESTLNEKGQTLPDEALLYEEDSIRWVAGGLDGAFGHHNDPAEASEFSKALAKAMKQLFKKNSPEALAALYHLLAPESTLNFIDSFMEYAIAADLTEDPSFYALAKWLLKNAPDREPVKAGIAMLGVCATADDQDLFIDIGKHEEFTLFSCVALLHSLAEPEEALFRLGKAVHGWGRIQVVERLENTTNEEIKAWLLKEGYKNNIMYEYTAYQCATTGDLLAALKQEEPDDELLIAAGNLLSSMNEPGTPLEEYIDAPQATLLLMRHLANREISISQFLSVNAIKELVLALPETETKSSGGIPTWAEVSEEVLNICEAMRNRSGWEEKIRAQLKSDNDQDFFDATRLADLFGIDTWEMYFERVKQGKEDWYFLMRTRDESRIEQAVALAEELLPLAEIASGADEKMGMGEGFKAHRCLDFVLQELREWPGHGYKLICTGLKSPVTRNRNLALKALQVWGKDHWQNDTEALLNELQKDEPNEQTRNYFAEILARDSHRNNEQ
ncbi:MAG TPA: hypothetical protein PLY72_20975 [Candidatus Obscuribacter sp.]|nr:hypothetical protein [Candidatus Obscuribacter sp.]